MSHKDASVSPKILREPVRRKLFFLTLIFISICTILLGTGEFLRQQDNHYHHALNNEIARHNLGKFLNKKLLSVENQIFRLSLTEDSRDLDVLRKSIDEALTGIQSALKVLRDGGTFSDVIPVNLNQINEVTETLHYSPPADSGYNIEVINLTPKVMDIEQLAASIHEKVKSKLAERSPERKAILERNITVLTKQAKSVLFRSNENVNKIFFDSNLQVQHLKKKWEAETRLLLTLRNWGTFLIVLMGAGLFFHTSRQIGHILQQRTDFAKNLEHSRQSLETILENTPVGIAILGNDRIIRMVNQSILHLIDVSSSKEIIGQHCFGYLCAQHSTGCPLDKFEHGVFDREVTLKTRTGQLVPVIKSAIPIELAGEKVILEAFLDISERKKAEQALQRATSKMSAMVAGMEEGIAFTDRTDRVVEVNRYFSELAKPFIGDLVGRDIKELFPPEQHSSLTQELEKFKISCPLHPSIFQVDNYLGIDCIIRLQPIYTDKEYDGLVLNVVDVTELTKARREAEKALRSKAHFLANMSHEIRTPLNGILGMAELLAGTSLNPEQKHFATTIQSSGEALLTILNDILDFSKIEAGKIHLEETSFNLGVVIEESVQLLAKLAHEKGLEVALQVPVDVHVPVKGDPHRLRQIVTNLLSNAIKFTEQGEIIIRVSGRSLENQKRLFRFSIADTGIGIDPERKEDLFKHFTQAEDSTTRRFGGSGLGLSISKQLVELMGGSLHLESTPGEGSTFWFELPLQEDAEDQDCRLSIPDFSGMKALLVEDHKPTRSIVEKHLATLGLDVRTAATSEEGLEILARKDGADLFDLVLLDMNLPELKELDIINAIVQKEPANGVSIVAMAPLGSFHKDQCTQGRHIHRVLSKPLRNQELIDTLGAIQGKGPASGKETDGHQAQEVLNQPLNLHVLVAEDNPVNQQVTMGMLNAIGCQADMAVNGLEAVDLFSKKDYDLVLMDCHMPVMDGFTAVSEIRLLEAQDGKYPVPIIALTAETQDDGLIKARQAGMDDFLGKPFTQAEIHLKLVKAMENAEQQKLESERIQESNR